GKLLEDHVRNDESGRIDGGGGILSRGHGTGNDMNLDGQPRAGHPNGIVNTILIVDDKLLGQTIDDFSAGWKLNRAGRIDCAAHVIGANFAVAAGYGDYRLAVKAHDMRAGEVDGYFL